MNRYSSLGLVESLLYEGDKNIGTEYSAALARLKQMDADLEDLRESNRLALRNLESIEQFSYSDETVGLSHFRAAISAIREAQAKNVCESMEREFQIKKNIVESELRLIKLIRETESLVRETESRIVDRFEFKHKLSNDFSKFVCLLLVPIVAVGGWIFFSGPAYEGFGRLDDIDLTRLELQRLLLQDDEEED